ncbi:MAG: hypothetical protein JST55_10215 [Bacteroidetes bacterium]|nr:hypothetical protein [Bacteroidota bacterium]
MLQNKKFVNLNYKLNKVYYGLIIFILLFNFNKAQSQYYFDESKLKPEVKEILLKLAKDNKIYSSFIGLVGVESPTQKSLDKLSKQDTTLLISLTRHPNPVIRCYSFRALTNKGFKNFFPLLIEHIQDTSRVECMYADVIFRQKAGDFFIDNVKFEYTNAFDYAMPNQVYLDSLQKYILDSVIIFTDNKLDYLKNILFNKNFNENYYDRIKYIASENIYANVALSKYRREFDAEIILKNFERKKYEYIYSKNTDSYNNCLFEAISINPDTIFWRTVKEKILTSKIERGDKNLVKALFKYQNDESEKLIDSLVKIDIEETYIKHPYLAILLYGLENSANENLLKYKFYIAEKHNITTPQIFNELDASDSIRTLKFVENFFSEYEKFYYNFSDYHWITYNNSERKIVKNILLYRYNIDPNGTCDLIKDLLITNYRYLFFNHYLDAARYINDERIKNLLLGMLLNRRKVDDEYYYIINALISYKDKELTKKMILNLKDNLYLKYKNDYSLKYLIDYAHECEETIKTKEMNDVHDYFPRVNF